MAVVESCGVVEEMAERRGRIVERFGERREGRPARAAVLWMGAEGKLLDNQSDPGRQSLVL